MCISNEHRVVMQARLKSLGVGKTVSQLQDNKSREKKNQCIDQKKVLCLTYI